MRDACEDDLAPGDTVLIDGTPGERALYDPALHEPVLGCVHGHRAACPHRCKTYDNHLVGFRTGPCAVIVRLKGTEDR